jgi:hypothetical protein
MAFAVLIISCGGIRCGTEVVPRAAFEVGHLLHDVLCGKAGNAGIFWPARSIRPVAHAARHYVRLAAMGDDVRQRRMV